MPSNAVLEQPISTETRPYVQPPNAPPDVPHIGRINTIFNVDRTTKTLWVKVNELKGLPTVFAGGLATIHVRVYVLPSTDKDDVVGALFARGIPTHGTAYKRWTVGYSVASNISVEEVRALCNFFPVPPCKGVEGSVSLVINRMRTRSHECCRNSR
jgi:hypothetical protein